VPEYQWYDEVDHRVEHIDTDYQQESRIQKNPAPLTIRAAKQ
jgi:hypothetical protein